MEENGKKLRERFNEKVSDYRKSRLFNIIQADLWRNDIEATRKTDLLINLVHEALTSGEHNLWTKEEWEAFLGAPRIRTEQEKNGGYCVKGTGFGMPSNIWKPESVEMAFVGRLEMTIVSPPGQSTPKVSSQRIELTKDTFTAGKGWSEKIGLALLAYAKEDYRVKNCMNQYLSSDLDTKTFLNPQLGPKWHLQDLLDYNEEWFWKYIKNVIYLGSYQLDSLFEDESLKSPLESENILTALGALKGLLGR